MTKRILRPWPDSRAEATLGAASLLLGACLVAMVVFVAVQAWPMFQHEGLAWLGAGGNVDINSGSLVNQGTIDSDAVGMPWRNSGIGSAPPAVRTMTGAGQRG